MGAVIAAVTALRSWRDEAGVKPGQLLPARLDGLDGDAELVARMARLDLAGDGELTATVPFAGGAAEIRAGALVDPAEEERKRAAERERLQGEVARAESKLANEGFVAKAPEHLVARRAREARSPATGARAAVTLAEAERYLLGLELFGMRFGLDRMRRLMTVLGSPQERYETIHVVGTNGKSSTARMTAAILRRHGLRTGTYLSPHLVSFTERVRIDDEDSSPERFAAAVERARHAAEMVDRTLGPDDGVTQFEALTAAAFDELAGAGVQVAVIEAGLGGRYDATNVIPSRVQVLTNVGLEHTRWLGPTVADIAREKLDVVQPRGILVVGRRPAPRRAGAGAAHVRRARGAPGRGGHERDPRHSRGAGPRRLPAAQLRGRARGRRGVPRARWTRAPWPPRRPRRWSRAASRSSTPAGHRPRRRAQPRRHGRAGRGAARLPRRPAPGGLHLDPRRQGRRRHAARAAAAVRRGHLHRERQPARAAARARCSRCAASSAARRRAPCATRARRSRQARAAAGPDGVALATGTIYLIADLLRPEGAERRSTL